MLSRLLKAVKEIRSCCLNVPAVYKAARIERSGNAACIVFLLLLTPMLVGWTKLPPSYSTWTVEVFGGGVIPKGGSTLVGRGSTPGLDAEFAAMSFVEADAGYQAADFLLLRMGLAAGRLDFSVRNLRNPAAGFESVHIGAVDVQTLKASALFHFPIPPANALFWERLNHDVEMHVAIGPVVAVTRFSDVTVSREGRDRLGITAITGRGDPSVGAELVWLFFIRDSGWMASLNAGLMFTRAGILRVETDQASNYETSTLMYQPLYFSLGAGYRF